MSRVGKMPIPVSDKVKIAYQDKVLMVKGEKGTLTRKIHPAIDLDINAGVIQVTMLKENRENRALQGMTRSLVFNMVMGVTNGFERVLEIIGIGYRAEIKGKSIILNLGYSNPVTFDLPDGVSARSEKNNIVKLSAIDKELLGRTAASIRQLRPPEPYKGKGIKYAEEYVQRKAGKTGTK